MKIYLLFTLFHLMAQIESIQRPTCYAFVKQKNHVLECNVITLNNTNNILLTNKTLTFGALSSIQENNLSHCNMYSHNKFGSSIMLAKTFFSNSLAMNDTLEIAEEFGCKHTSRKILAQTLISLFYRVTFNHIIILYENKDTLYETARDVQENLENSTTQLFYVKIFQIDISSVENLLKDLMVETVDNNKQLILVVLGGVSMTLNIMTKAKDIGISGFDVTWVTLKASFPSTLAPPYHLSYQVLGYDLITKSISNNDVYPCRLMEVIRKESKQTVREKTYEAISDISMLINTNWISLFEGRYNHFKNITENELILEPTSSIYHTNAMNILVKRKKLKVVSITEGPFLYEREDLYFNEGLCPDMTVLCRKPRKNGTIIQWHYSCCFGYSVDLILSISKLLGFQTELYLVADGKYGGYDSTTGKYNGMVGDVVDGTADVAVAGLTISNQRSHYIDFTMPFMRTEIGIVTLRKIEEEKNYFNLDFIANLDDETKYAVIILYVLSMIILFGLDNFALYFEDRCDRKNRNVARKLYPIEECFSYISGLSFQRDLGALNPRSYGGRATAIFFAFGMMAVSTVYTASLTASKVANNNNGDFKGLKDKRFLNPTPAFKFATSKDTSIEQFFKSSPLHDYKQMFYFMRKYNVESVSEGITKVLNGELQAYLNEYPFLNHIIPKLGQCKVVLHSNTVGESGYGFAVEKGSPLKDILSQAILLLSEKGELRKFNKRWLSDVCKSFENENSNEEFSLNFFATPFIFIGGFAILCGFGVIFETYIYNYFLKKKLEKDQLPPENKWNFDDVREGYM